MEQTILYYNNETNALYFDTVNDVGYVEEKDNDQISILLLMTYLFGFYHLSWYIVNTSRHFLTEDIQRKLTDCRLIFRIMNENFEMFDERNLEKMDTNRLLEDTLKFFGEECDSEISCESGSNESESECDSENEMETSHSNEEIEAANTLTSMGRNWEFNH